MAAQGKYFSDNEIIEFIEGGPVTKGQPIRGLSKGLESEILDARDKDGKVIDHSKKIHSLLEKCQKQEIVPIIQYVYGSATGLR